ncbi:MAG: hypothetical protein ABH873_08535 [Candidatus Firestonebacteria bacterium]
MRKLIYFVIVVVFVVGVIPTNAFSEVIVEKQYYSTSEIKVRALIFYRDGKEIARKVFDIDGNIKEVIGKIPDGIAIEYRKNGKIREERSYKNGELNGLSKQYDINGNKTIEGIFKDGKLELTRKYDTEGKPRLESNYKNNRLNGATKKYYDNGKVIEEIYKDGKKIKYEGDASMDILNKIGLVLNIIGSLLIAFSFGKHLGGAYNLNRKGKKIYMVSFKYPKMFWVGVIILVIGFIIQII